MRRLLALAALAAAAACAQASPAAPAPSAAGDEEAATPASVALSEQPPSSASPSPPPAAGCRPGDPLAGVYHPARLTVLSPCQEARGTVLAVIDEADGDRHIWLAPDPGFERLLNGSNFYRGRAALVLEIIPECPGTPADARAAARCPPSRLLVPRDGDHVRVLGPWVLDTHHGWNEIHPVEAISRV